MSPDGNGNIQLSPDMVDTEASQYFLDPTLLPQVNRFMVNAQRNDPPIGVIGAGPTLIQGPRTGHLKVVPTDSNDMNRLVDVILLPELRNNVFSQTTAKHSAIATTVKGQTGAHFLPIGRSTVPLQVDSIMDPFMSI